MKTPEEIALIGGGILLSSGLVFGLKSGVASELPNVEHSVATTFPGKKSADDSSNSSNSDSANSASQAAAQQKQQQAQEKQAFDSNYQQAQQRHWQTGQWGTAQYYIDDGNNFHVGSGQLQGALENTLGHDKLQQIQTINLDGPAQAPQNSQDLFGLENGSGENIITQVNGLTNLDTSQVTDMEDMFAFDNDLSNLDVSNFDTSHVTNMYEMFDNDSALSSLNLSNFNTSSVNDARYMFAYDSSLSNLDLSHFDTSQATDMEEMFADDNIKDLTLGPSTKLQNNNSNSNYDADLNGNYQSNGQTLSLDGNAHPGTWVQQ